MRGVPHKSLRRLCGPTTGRMILPETPPVASCVLAQHPRLVRKSQDPLVPHPTKGCDLTDPRRLPPTGPTAAALACARATSLWAATGTPAWPPKVQLPTCVHAPFREALDPRASGCSPGTLGPHAACQFLQWTVPRARPRASRSPLRAVASHGCRGNGFPCGLPPAGLPQVRGRLVCSTVDPHHNDRSLQWIYPNLTGPDTSCRESMSRPAWKTARLDGPAVGASTGTDSPGAPRSRPAHLVGPSPVLPREGKTRATAPEVPSAAKAPHVV